MPNENPAAPGRRVSTDRRHLIGGGIVAAATLALVLAHTGRFLSADVPAGTTLYILALLACLLLGVLTAVRLTLGERTRSILSTAVYLLLPIVAMTMVECLNGVFTWDWSPQTLLHNYILYFILYGTVYVCSGSLRLPMLIVNPLLFVLAVVNHYVMAFRGTPFVPIDLLSAGTAANVVAAYDFSFDHQMIIAVLLLVFLLLAGWRLYTPRMDIVLKIATRVFCGTLAVCVVCIYFFTDLYASAGLRPDFWNQARGYRRSGVVLNFSLNLKYLYVTKPAGYRAEDIDDILQNTIDEADVPDGTGTSTPHIICIMNESLADLSVLGDLQTNIDYMPFLHSLQENTVRGNLYVPVIGSGTSNTEFEFLTGVPTAFFPAGSNAFMLYMKNPLPSLVSILGDQGYSKLAFHPYYASGWNRVNVYNNLGFSRFTTIGSLIPNRILTEYQNSGFSAAVLEQLVEEAYPGQEVLLRRYVSDSYNYQKVIEMYEQRIPGEPFFLFNVTMQNHGGYTEVAENFTEEVYALIDGEPAPYPRANQYLSLIKRSDDAFRDLIAYFEQQEEPTVICLFGDHQPGIEDGFFRELMGVRSLYNLPAEQNLKRYITPFYIWANYDIEEEYIQGLSANYLSSYVLQVAGVEMTDYNRYLLGLSRTLPVITAAGYMDAQGQCYDNGASSAYSSLINDYNKVVYNLMFDADHRQEALYSLSHR